MKIKKIKNLYVFLIQLGKLFIDLFTLSRTFARSLLHLVVCALHLLASALIVKLIFVCV